MYEDEEYLEDEIGTEEESKTQQALALKRKKEEAFLVRKKQFLRLFIRHIQNFHKQLLLRRRRAIQCRQRRREMMRSFFLQHLISLESRYLELFTLPGICAVFCDRPHETPKSSADNSNSSADNTPMPDAKPQRGYYETAIHTWSNAKWSDKYRMSKKHFFWFCEQLRSMLQASDMIKISTEKHVAIALYTFATGEDYESVSELFSIPKNVVYPLLRRFAEALLEKLGACLLAMPKNDEEYKDIRLGFRKATKMPALVVGVLGMCEIPIRSYMENSHISNEMGCASIVLQALIDDHMLFRKVRVQNKRPNMYLDSPHEIAKIGFYTINQQHCTCFLITPNSYPLRPWLMHEFEQPRTLPEHDFNAAIRKVNAIRDQAFIRLFSRWKILQSEYDLEPRAMEPIATACCALHNLLEEAEQPFNAAWIGEFELSDLPQNIQRHFYKFTSDTEDASATRDFLARLLSEKIRT